MKSSTKKSVEKIGWYASPTNPGMAHYRGIYRNNDLVDYMQIPSIKDSVLDFLDHSHEGMFIDYSTSHMRHIVSFFDSLNKYGWRGDIVVFSSNLTDCDHSYGYDICSDSLHYSPLGDGFLCSYDDGNRFHRLIGKTKLDSYLKHLHAYGLFDNKDIAESFAYDCTTASKQYDHIIETESSWYPIAINIIKTYL